MAVAELDTLGAFARMSITHFANDDSGYFAWRDAHPDGFVLNASHIGTHDINVTLHRASCRRIGGYQRDEQPGCRTDTYHKLCCDTRQPLEDWASTHKQLTMPFTEYECAICSP